MTLTITLIVLYLIYRSFRKAVREENDAYREKLRRSGSRTDKTILEILER